MNGNDIPPLRIDIKFRNNIILKKMEDFGIKNVAELSRRIQTHQSEISKLINMTVPPNNKSGSWISPVLLLADFFNCLPEELFSEEQLTNTVVKQRISVEMTYCELLALTQSEDADRQLPEKVTERSELTQLVEKILGTLGHKQAEVIRMRFGIGDYSEHTLEETALHLHVTSERVRQIELHAIRRLQHPLYANYLAQFLERSGEDIKKLNKETSVFDDSTVAAFLNDKAT